MTQPKTVHGPMGFCIYCGRTDGKLTKEHVVPEALGGVHVLTRASCDVCRETLNHKVDKPAIRALMQGRAAYGFKSKRTKKGRKIKVVHPPDQDKFLVSEFAADYPVDDYFESVALPQLVGPPSLLHPEGKKPEFSMWCDIRGSGSIMMDAPLVDGALYVAAMVAKTAFAAAAFEGYQVSRAELRNALRDPLLHVGRAPEGPVGRGNLPYNIGSHRDGNNLVFRIQFFASAPIPYAFSVVWRL